MAANSDLRGIGAMALATAAFVTNDTLMKLAMADIPPLEVLVLRGFFATLWCVPTILLLGLGRHIPKTLNGWVLLRAGCEAVAVILFVTALARAPIGDITAIMQLSPLIVVAVAAAMLREPLGAGQALLIGLGFGGALMVAQPGYGGGAVLALAGFPAAVMAAGRDLLARKAPSATPALVVALATIVVVMLGALAASRAFETAVAPSAFHLLLTASAGLFLMFGQLFVFLAYRLARASVVAPFLYLATAWAALSGVIVFHDLPGPPALAGMALIAGAGLATMLRDSRRRAAAV